jgi:Peptidase family M1 domain
VTLLLQHATIGPMRPLALLGFTLLGLGIVAPPRIAAAGEEPPIEQRYTIAATLDPNAATLDATETLELTYRGSGELAHVDLSVIPRALGYLTLNEPVTVNGDGASVEWTTSTNLRVSLPEPIGRHEIASIEVSFALAIGSSPDAFSARLSLNNGVLSFGEWFPILSREHDVYGIGDPQVSYNAESIRLELETTTQLGRDAVACPGMVEAPATTGTRWVCETTDVRDFSFVVNPRFRLTTREVGETALRVYTETVNGTLTADLAVQALIGLGEVYGPYPWPDLMIAEVGAGGGFSMEYPRAIHLTRGKVTDTYVLYHEVAHQWFYAQVGNDQMLEPWLDEGFADFSARYLMGIGENQCSTRAVDNSVFAWEAGATTGGDWTSCDGYFHTVFYKGTEFLNSLRAAMGDDAFFAAMRGFVDAHRYGVVTARDLLGHLSRETDANLRPTYRAYLAGPLGRPAGRAAPESP